MSGWRNHWPSSPQYLVAFSEKRKTATKYRLLVFCSPDLDGKRFEQIATCGVKVHKVVRAVLKGVGGRRRVVPAQPSVPVAAAVRSCGGTELNVENRKSAGGSCASSCAYLSCCTVAGGSFSQSICTGCPGSSSWPFPAPPGSPWDWPWPRQKGPPPGPPRTARLPSLKASTQNHAIAYMRDASGLVFFLFGFGLIWLVLSQFIAHLAFFTRLLCCLAASLFSELNSLFMLPWSVALT